MCTVLMPPGDNPIAVNKYIKYINIKVDLQEVGGGSGDCMELAQNRDSRWALVTTVRNFRVPKMRGIS